MSMLVKNAKAMDDTRLVSAAFEVRYNAGINYVDDPLGEYADILQGFNRKGLIDEKGNRKKAFYTLQQYYKEMKQLWD